MISPIFIDANIPIYASGRNHPLKAACQQLMLLIGDQPDRFVTNAEVFQELLHRYHALRMWELGRAVFGEFSELMRDRVLPIEHRHTTRAAELLSQYAGLSARDAVHIAVMLDTGIDHVVTADRKFDLAPGITRLDPAQVATWA